MISKENKSKTNSNSTNIEDRIEKDQNKNKIDKYLRSIKYKLIFRSPVNLFYQKLFRQIEADFLFSVSLRLIKL